MKSKWLLYKYKEEHDHCSYKESEYIEKSQTDQLENIREVFKISQDELPPMPEKPAFMFHYTFYPKPRIDLEDEKYQNECKKNYKY